MPLPLISPPVLNSANPWATTAEDLQALFDCPHTGAITTRTSLLDAFPHDPAIHQHTFFDPQSQTCRRNDADYHVSPEFSGSLNTLGYSPIPLSSYLDIVRGLSQNSTLPETIRSRKPVIVSVTGTAEAVAKCYEAIQTAQQDVSNPLCMEINLSCPNIPDHPPPAYSGSALSEYLHAVKLTRTKMSGRHVLVGIKTPPYTYHDQFKTLIEALEASCDGNTPCVDFITATNTLGSSLVLDDIYGTPALQSAAKTGIGGMAGAPLHPLALGNVKTIRNMLDSSETLRSIDIIGVGGVSDGAGMQRMQAVGASVVAVGTALGRNGVAVFEKIALGVPTVCD